MNLPGHHKEHLALGFFGNIKTAIVAKASGVAATDSASINAALTAAGIGGKIVFPSYSGTNYVTWGCHELLSKQTWDDTSAVVQMANQVSSLLASGTITGAGISTLNVTNNVFTVGQWIGATVDDPGQRFTATIATATDILTVVGHNLLAGYRVKMYSTGTLPNGSGAVAASVFPVVDALFYVLTVTGNTFQLSLTSGGAAFDFVDSGSGTLTLGVWGTYDTSEGGLGTGNYAVDPSKITAITANGGTWDLAISPPMFPFAGTTAPRALSAANGTMIHTTQRMFVAGYTAGVKQAWASLPTDINLGSIRIDGNSANNPLGNWWNLSECFLIGCHNFIFRNPNFLNVTSDALIVSGNNVRILGGTAVGTGGNVLHPGSWEGAGKGVNGGSCVDFYSSNSNQNVSVGHANAAFCFSNDVYGWRYTDCIAWGSLLRGFASGHNALDWDTVCQGNVAINCERGGFQFYGGSRVVYSGNIQDECGSSKTSAIITVSEIADVQEMVYTSNVSINSTLIIRGGTTNGLILSGNVFSDNHQYSNFNWTYASVAILAAGANLSMFANSFRYTGNFGVAKTVQANGATWANGIATLTVNNTTGVRVGDLALVSGVSVGAYNVNAAVVAVTTTQISYNLPGAAPGTGTGGSVGNYLINGIASSATTPQQYIGNRFYGFSRALRMIDASNYTIAQNIIIDPMDYGVAVDETVACEGKLVASNAITLSAAAIISNPWYGVLIQLATAAGNEYTFVENNHVRSKKTTGTQVGIYLNNTTNHRLRAVNNKLFMDAQVNSLTINAAAAVDANCHLLGNVLSKAMAANMAAATLIYPAADSNMIVTTT